MKSVVVELFEDGAVRVATPHPTSLEFIRRALGTLAPTDDSQALRGEVERLKAETMNAREDVEEAARRINRIASERDTARLEVGKLDARLAAAESTLARIRSRVGVTLWNLLAQEARPWEGHVLDFESGAVPNCYLPPAPK